MAGGELERSANCSIEGWTLGLRPHLLPTQSILLYQRRIGQCFSYTPPKLVPPMVWPNFAVPALTGSESVVRGPYLPN